MSDFESDQFSFTNSQFSSERTRVWEFAVLLYRPAGFTVSDRGSPRMINENWELRIGQISPEILDTKPRYGRYGQHSVCGTRSDVSGSRFGHRHYFQQMAVRVFEVKTTPATTLVDPVVGVVERVAAVGQPFVLHPAEDCIKLRIADMERVVMTLSNPGIQTRPSPCFRLICEREG